MRERHFEVELQLNRGGGCAMATAAMAEKMSTLNNMVLVPEAITDYRVFLLLLLCSCEGLV